MRLLILLSLVALAPLACAQPDSPEPLLRRSIPLPGVTGRIGHLACDSPNQRLYVAADKQGSLEVVDLAAGQRVASVSGLKRPRGVIMTPDGGLVIVTCAGDGTVRAYDPRTLAEKAARTVGDDVDNLVLSDRTGRLLVGYGSGALMILQPRSLNHVDQIPLKGHPAAFQLDAERARVFINVPGNWLTGGGRVLTADLNSKQVTQSWELKGAGLNYPMAYDAARQRLYVVCRRPARLLALDANTGQTISSAECAGDADDVFIDAITRRLYVIGGAGRVDVFACGEQACARTTSIETAPGAATGLFVPDRRALFVAVPARIGHAAEIREYMLRE